MPLKPSGPDESQTLPQFALVKGRRQRVERSGIREFRPVNHIRKSVTCNRESGGRRVEHGPQSQAPREAQRVRLEEDGDKFAVGAHIAYAVEAPDVLNRPPELASDAVERAGGKISK